LYNNSNCHRRRNHDLKSKFLQSNNIHLQNLKASSIQRGLGRGHLLLLLLFGTIIAANGQREEPNPIPELFGWKLPPFFGNVANGQGGKTSPNPEPTTSADTGSRIGHNQHWLMSDGRVRLAPGWDGKIDSYTNCQKETKEDDT
jgi:hypothetical protein